MLARERECDEGGRGRTEREVLSPPSQDNIQSGIQWSLETGDICLASNVSGSTQLQGTGTLYGTLPQCYYSTVRYCNSRAQQLGPELPNYSYM